MIVTLNSPLKVLLILFSMCGLGNRLARQPSYTGIYIRDEMRPFLLIFEFNMIKISIFCIISQACIYVLIALYAAFKLSFLAPDLADTLFLIVAVIQLLLLAIGNTEVAIYEHFED